MKQLKNSLLSNATLKIVSLIFGSSFWIILNNQHTRTIELNVPVCLFDQNEQHDITIPSEITIGLSGKRKDLQTLDLQSLAVHVNAHKLSHGQHSLIIDQTTLFLPNSVKLVHYSPSNNVIEVIDHSLAQKADCLNQSAANIQELEQSNTQVTAMNNANTELNQNTVPHA